MWWKRAGKDSALFLLGLCCWLEGLGSNNRDIEEGWRRVGIFINDLMSKQ